MTDKPGSPEPAGRVAGRRSRIPTGRRSRIPTGRSIALVASGCVVALVLGLVLFARIGPGSSGSPAASSPSTAAVAPGLDAASASLLDLDILSGTSSKAAPDFTLTDQYGEQVSLSQYRGKAVVLSFNDDRCTDLCTLLAQDTVVANRDLGSADKDVVFLAVNANPFYPQVSAVKAWTDEHGLGGQPNWVFATGLPARLKAIWKDYGAYVILDKADRTVVHSTQLYFIDPSGREQALASFGTNAANTSLFAHDMAQMASDLLPSSEQVKVGGPSTLAPAQSDAAVGASAPFFALPMLKDPKVTLSSPSLRGKYVVLNFWASTCTACVREMPSIEKAYRQMGSGVSVVGVDVSDDPTAASAFAKKVGVTYPLVTNASGSVAGSYQITGLPFTVVIGPGGKLLIRHPGVITTEQLVYLMQSLNPAMASS